MAKPDKLVNGINNINHKVFAFLASNIILINDFIGNIFFYLPS